jgi:hypothetical protein
MTSPPPPAVRIIDAGPSLNFLSTKNERILLAVVGGHLHAPQTVQDEVFRRSRRDRRFDAAKRKWEQLVAVHRLTVLPDDPDPKLEDAVQRITNQPMAERILQSKDLGEIMVLAHAAVKCEAGEQVHVLIDDGRARDLAASEIDRIDRMRAQDEPFGELRVYGTLEVLEAAAGSKYIPDRGTMRRVYGQLRGCDDGLVPIDRTRLLAASTWPPDRSHPPR